MKILHFIPYFTEAFGGPVRHLKMLSQELARAGHEPVIYTSNLADKTGETTDFSGEAFDVRAFPVKAGIGDYFFTPDMKTALREEDFDVAHAHCYRNYQADLAAWIAEKQGRPLVLTAHGTLPKLPGLRDRFLKSFYDTISRWKVLGRAERLIALSSQESEQYQSLGASPKKIVTIYHGIDTDVFIPPNNGDSIRQDLGLGPGPIVLFVGRLHERKGIQFLLPAFKKVLSEFPSATLVICGPDYGYRGAIVRQIEGSSIHENVVLTGEIPERLMPQLYGTSDVVVLPAQYEVFGQVLAEAASCGRATVATRWGWAAEFFEDQKDCLLVEEYGDVVALTGALLELLRHPDLRASLGANARAKVLESLSWSKCAEEHLQLYEGAIAA